MLLAGIGLLGALLHPQAASLPPSAYLDSTLQQASASASVIVEAASVADATRAIQRVGGSVTSELWLIDAAAAVVPGSRLAALAHEPGVTAVVPNHTVRSSDVSGWVTDRTLPDHWDGRPDVQPTADPQVWNLVNPVTIDIGADVLHETQLPSGDAIRGGGVTIALVDSGVYFDETVRAQLGPVVQRQFVGQADFVDTTCDRRRGQDGRVRRHGSPDRGFCWQGHNDTQDGYGHGTAVASIIWNNFRDAGTGVTIGVAPEASVLSVRVLDDNGVGSYETVIRGIQYVVEKRARYDIRLMNLSLSADPSMPYFVDPLGLAVERAWAKGITVLVAAGNGGPSAETISAPGNNPYVITVGAVDENRTPGYWADDTLPTWSAVGPTADGFVKPDLLAPGANIITFMHSNSVDRSLSQKIVQLHPDYSATTSLFRMSGTSMSTAVATGVAALMLQANPDLTPDEVKYRLMTTARGAITAAEPPVPVYSVLQQGMGRVWAPDAVLGTFDREGDGNPGMRIVIDLAHEYRTERSLRFHYQGPVQRALSDDGSAYLYYFVDSRGVVTGIAVARADGRVLIDRDTLAAGRMAWTTGRMAWTTSQPWVGGLSLAAGRMAWTTGRMAWTTGRMAWTTGRMAWTTSRDTWAGGMAWSVDPDVATSGRMAWTTNLSTSITGVSTTRWVDTP